MNTSQEILGKQSIGLAKQQALLSQQKLTIDKITGGDSFCYLRLFTDTNAARVMLIRQGDAPLYNVNFRMWNINKSLTKEEVNQGYDAWTKGDYKKEVGDVPPNTVLMLDTIPLPNSDKNDFSIEINARNG